MNQDSWMPRINRDICTGCKACIETCPTNALGRVRGKANLSHPDRCTYCLACEDVCPVGAIELPFLIQIKGKEKPNDTL